MKKKTQSKQELEKRVSKALEPIYDIEKILVGYGIEINQLTNILKLTIMMLIKIEKRELLEDLLKNGHGGGNWRRLIDIRLGETKTDIAEEKK